MRSMKLFVIDEIGARSVLLLSNLREDRTGAVAPDESVSDPVGALFLDDIHHLHDENHVEDVANEGVQSRELADIPPASHPTVVMGPLSIPEPHIHLPRKHRDCIRLE